MPPGRSSPVRSCAALILLTGAAAAALAQAPPPGADAAARAEQVLAEARQALGGDKLAAVKTLTATGRTRRVRGDNLVPIEFEILIELPDKYVRIDEFPAEDADPTAAGFNGDALVQNPPPSAMPAPGRGGMDGPMPPGGPGAGRVATPPGAVPPPEAASAGRGEGRGGAAGAGGPPGMPGAAAGRGPAMDPRRARVATLKQEYTRLALGLFAHSTVTPLTFSYVGLAEAPQGQADVLDATGDGTIALRYFVDRKTRLPLMVSWTTPPTSVIVTVPGQPAPRTVAPGAVVVTGPPPPAADAPKEEADRYAREVLAVRTKAQTTPVEHRLYYADYRDVDGVRFPFRLRRAIGSETTEETTFDRFRINARIDARKLQPVK